MDCSVWAGLSQNGIMLTINVHDIVLVCSLEHLVWPVVRLLQWYASGIVSNKHMSTCRQGAVKCEKVWLATAALPIPGVFWVF